MLEAKLFGGTNTIEIQNQFYLFWRGQNSLTADMKDGFFFKVIKFRVNRY